MPANDNGKANEWAFALELSRRLSVPLEMDATALHAKAKFEQLTSNTKDTFSEAASKAVEHILYLEAKTLASFPPVKVWMPPDSYGQVGDVRDVICLSDDFAFGVSCKHNHEAYKHSRLSARVDWVKKWGIDAAGCSEQYWSRVRPVFQMLAQLRRDSGATALFTSIQNMHSVVYQPVIGAFEKELQRVFVESSDSEAAVASFVKYIIGNHDFYKVTTRQRTVTLQRFNFASSLSGPRGHLPTKIIGIDRMEGSANSINVRFDRGYVFNFRIHSASSRIEPSLKFDIQAIGLPSSEIYRHEISLV